MKSTVNCLTFLGVMLAASPTLAMVCENDAVNGTAPAITPDDNGFGTATACGNASRAEANRSLALGDSADATGVDSMAIGRDASASGGNSIAIGESTLAVAMSSLALGFDAAANADSSTAVGPSSSASGVSSVALGEHANAVTATGTAIGWRAQVNQDNAIVLGSVDGLNGADSYADVGIGTNAPDAPLHVHRNDGTALILVEETSAEVGPRTLFTLANPGNTKFEIMNTDAANSWAFTNSGTDFRISLQDSGVVEFKVFNNGNAALAGLLSENSDRHAKTAITPVNPEDVLQKVTALPIAEWSYKDAPRSRHIGPMAQDFYAAFATGTHDTQLASMDLGGVAIAAIQALQAQNQSLQAKNVELEGRIAHLESIEQEMADMRAMLRQVLPEIAQN